MLGQCHIQLLVLSQLQCAEHEADVEQCEWDPD